MNDTTPSAPILLKIWQQNTNKSMYAQQDLLETLQEQDADIVCIQEPYLDHWGNTRANAHWRTVYPPSHRKDHTKTRSLIMIRTRISTDQWTIIPIDSQDVTAIRLTSAAGALEIVNIYNDCTHSETIRAVDACMQARWRATLNKKVASLWVGDFNRHHPMWDEPRNQHLFTTANLESAEELIEITANHGLVMALEKYTPTLRAMNSGNYTRTDNVFITDDFRDRILQCKTFPELRPPKTDHIPILTSLDIDRHLETNTPKFNFRKVDWKDFKDTLRAHLPDTRESAPPEIHNPHEFHAALQRVAEAIEKAIERNVPKSRPSPYSKRWWTADLTEMKKANKTLARRAYRHRGDPEHTAHEEHEQVRRRYADAIEKAKKSHWEEWLESLQGEEIWVANKYVDKTSSDGAQARIPTLKRKDEDGAEVEVETNEAKSRYLFESFFSQDDAQTPSLVDHTYPEPAFAFCPVTNAQIHRAIDKLHGLKAPGDDGVPNIVYKNCSSILVPFLGPIFRATFALSIYPQEWKDSRTLVLRKLGKPDYSNPNAYRPIALLRTIAKILSACIASELMQLAELHHLLPDTHFGCRAGRKTTDSLHYVTRKLHDAMDNKEAACVLFLDIKGAFPSINLDRLIHNMRKRGVPKEYTEWIRIKTENRRTKLVFDGYTSDWLTFPCGADQGCPLSGILFQFYNADLLDVPNRADREDGVAFVDDTAYIATAETMEEAAGKLRDMMERAGGAFEWADTHNCTFAVDKFALVGFTRKKEKVKARRRVRTREEARRRDKQDKKFEYRALERPSIALRGTHIHPSKSHKFLGIIIDQELNFKEHAASALAKGTKWVTQYRRLARPSKGVSSRYMRQFYTSVALPKMLYGVDIFLSPPSCKGKGSKGIIEKLARVQRQAAIHITGTMRTTATDTLDAHADLLPFSLLVDKKCHDEATRLATLADKHPLHRHTLAAAEATTRTPDRSPLHRLLNEAYAIFPSQFEDIKAVRLDPKWQSVIHTSIDPNKEGAIEAEENNNDKV